MPDTGVFRLAAPSRDLQSWVERDWSGGVALERLHGLEQFAVRTRNTTYEITILAPRSGEVLVRGGQFFPDHTRVALAGASLGGSFLKIGAIHPGFAMELIHDGRRIVTSRVREIASIPPARPH